MAVSGGGLLRASARWRWVLWSPSAAITAAVSLAAPASSDRVIASAQFSVAFFATILTGEAVIFAIAFSSTSSWPALQEIDAHIAFREWVVVGWLGAMLLGIGLLAPAGVCSMAGAILFLLADLLGIFSFVRLFALASVGGRKRLMSRTLQRRMETVPVSLPLAAGLISSDEVLARFTRELDGALGARDGNGARDLVEQLTSTWNAAQGAELRAGLHLEVLHRVCRAALIGSLDSLVAVACARDLIDSLVRQVDEARPGRTGPGLAPDRAAALAGQLGRYLAWLTSAALTLSARGVVPSGPARELIACAVDGREAILLALDPDPVTVTSSRDLGTVLGGPLGALVWLRQFVEFHGSAQAAAFYPTYQVLTGTKFEGNYWDGASVLTELREALFGGTRLRTDTAQAQQSRVEFGTAQEFDRLWILLSVGAFATLRDRSIAHPPALIRPEFTPDTQLLGAYLRSYASHRPFTTADGARMMLLDTLGRDETASSLWNRTRTLLSECHYPTPLPVIEPQQRLSAAVLAVAARLAPVDPAGSDRQLRAFLSGLPRGVLDVTSQLATRTLPEQDGPQTAREPIDEIVRRLEIIHLPTATLIPTPRTP